MDGDERNPVDSESVAGSEMESSSKDFWLEARFIVQGDDVAGKVPSAPRFLNDSNFGVADESWSDEELKNQRRDND
jgi:hypothetical protein